MLGPHYHYPIGLIFDILAQMVWIFNCELFLYINHSMANELQTSSHACYKIETLLMTNDYSSMVKENQFVTFSYLKALKLVPEYTNCIKLN